MQERPMEGRVVCLIEERGPVTGAGIREALGDEPFAQWRACMLSDRLTVRRVGRRYLRLDDKVEGYARLSPSILREFLTYSVVGLDTDGAALDLRAEELATHVREVSEYKLRLVQNVVNGVAARVAEGDGPKERFCVFVAGDIVYQMAHDVPRPERSTGRMVKGSDLDVVVIMDDEAPESLQTQLDDAIYEQKYRCLINPSSREEIDYNIKRLARLREQSEFDTFKKMVACKILEEGVLLYGSGALFAAAKALLEERGVVEKLREMERSATASRRAAEQYLLSTDRGLLAGDDLYLFYTAEESEEFE